MRRPCQPIVYITEPVFVSGGNWRAVTGSVLSVSDTGVITGQCLCGAVPTVETKYIVHVKGGSLQNIVLVSEHRNQNFQIILNVGIPCPNCDSFQSSILLTAWIFIIIVAIDHQFTPIQHSTNILYKENEHCTLNITYYIRGRKDQFNIASKTYNLFNFHFDIIKFLANAASLWLCHVSTDRIKKFIY